MFTNSPSLVCMDLSLSQEEIIDPKYSWTGPDGRNLEGERLSAAHAGLILPYKGVAAAQPPVLFPNGRSTCVLHWAAVLFAWAPLSPPAG